MSDKPIIFTWGEESNRSQLEIPWGGISVLEAGSEELAAEFFTAILAAGKRKSLNRHKHRNRHFNRRLEQIVNGRFAVSIPTLSIKELVDSFDMQSTVGDLLGLSHGLNRLFSANAKLDCPGCRAMMTPSNSENSTKLTSSLFAYQQKNTGELDDKRIALAIGFTVKSQDRAKEIVKHWYLRGYRRFIIGSLLYQLPRNLVLTDGGSLANIGFLRDLNPIHSIAIVLDLVSEPTALDEAVSETRERAVRERAPYIAALPLLCKPTDDVPGAVAVNSEFIFALNPWCSDCFLVADPGEPFASDEQLPHSMLIATTIGNSRSIAELASSEFCWHSLSIEQFFSLSLKNAAGFIERWIADSVESQANPLIAAEVLKNLKLIADSLVSYLPLNRKVSGLSSGEKLFSAALLILISGLTETLLLVEELALQLGLEDRLAFMALLERCAVLGNTVLVCESGRAIRPTIVSANQWVDSFGAVKLQHEGLGQPQLFAAFDGQDSVDLEQFIGRVTAITGPLGSGKSRLVQTLASAFTAIKSIKSSGQQKPLMVKLFNFETVIRHRKILNTTLAQVLEISPLIAQYFASLPEVRRAGLTAVNFDLASKHAYCPRCLGRGEIAITLNLISRNDEICPTCFGTGFCETTLQFKAQGAKRISDVLELTVAGAKHFFSQQSKLREVLSIADRAGFGAIKLGEKCLGLPAGKQLLLLMVRTVLSKKVSECLILLIDQARQAIGDEEFLSYLAVFRALDRSGSTLIFTSHSYRQLVAADGVINLSRE